MYIEKINTPADLKKMTAEEKQALVDEIRTLLIHRMPTTGGHVGPNLGMIEPTVALHDVFTMPYDKIVFDVSHQTYTHKILTERKIAFTDPDHYFDLSGFTSPDESEYDLFTIGHTSTSLSLALGLAKARDMRGSDENVVAIIGDGSLSGGQALESLSIAGELGTNFIMIVNDNGMSIAENHGGLYENLKKLRETKGAYPCNIFKAMNLDYIFVENGNNLKEITEVLKRVKNISKPVVIHMVTQKGMGYDYAEKEKEVWHYHQPYDEKTGKNINNTQIETYTTLTRDYILEKTKKDKEVTVILAGTPSVVGFWDKERKEVGKQYMDVGIAEEAAVSIASGMAKNDGKPLLAIYSSFLQRAFDQLSQDVCINKTPITMLVNNASLYGTRDKTHLGIFDIPLISHIPELVYLAPTNANEYMAMLEWSLENKKFPVAIRMPVGKTKYTKREVRKNYDEINKSEIIQDGNTVAIYALGQMMTKGEELAEEIQKTLGIKATLINPIYITGIDEKIAQKVKEKHKIIITLEDGIKDGGYGERIAAYFSSTDIKVKIYGLAKEFLDRYDIEEILKQNGMTVPQIIQDIKEIL